MMINCTCICKACEIRDLGQLAGMHAQLVTIDLGYS